MLRKIKLFFHRWLKYRQRNVVHSDLDILLSQNISEQKLEDQLAWLVRVLNWVRYEGVEDGKPQTRLKFLLMVLDRNPGWKKQIAVTLRGIIKNVRGFELFTETGISKENAFWSEWFDRFLKKMLPSPPLEEDLSHLFWSLFPSSGDALWLSQLDDETFQKVVNLFSFEMGHHESFASHLVEEIEIALDYLIIQIRALGLASGMRRRMQEVSLKDSLFYRLREDFEAVMRVQHTDDKLKIETLRLGLLETLKQCDQEIEHVYRHLDQYGVSLGLVYQMMRLRGYLQRVQHLTEMLFYKQGDSRVLKKFIVHLVHDNHELQSLRSLWAQNGTLLAKKIIESAAHTGDHYIARTTREYCQMLRMAAGGGGITTFTVYLKFFILKMGAAGFIEGLLASLNYSVSFLIIHFAGFTLGTKQPAMTAPALAEKMVELNSAEKMDHLVKEVKYLIRSQVASILGNILLVVPLALLVHLAYFFLFKSYVMTTEKALGVFQSVDILGPTLIYGAFTGVLLWLSSVVSGSAENWFALHSLKRSLFKSTQIRTLFGDRGARWIGMFLNKNFSGIVGNIFLGFLLGMVPEIMKFLGLPLDIRHVTLSSGNLAAALPVVGYGVLSTWTFWRAMMGILGIGFMNVLVSFSLAFYVAIKAQGITYDQRRALRRALFKELLRAPCSFVFPLR